MNKLYSIWINKGGVGKTPLSFSLCRDLNYTYTTNEKGGGSYFPLELLEKTINHKEIDNHSENIIFDGGGYLDNTIIPILKKSNYLLIPIEVSNVGLVSFYQIYNELTTILDSNKILLIITNIENIDNNSELDKMINQLNKLGINDNNIFKIRKSKPIFDKLMYEENKSIKEIYKDNKLNKHRYKNIYNDYKKLLNFLEK